MQTKLVYLVTTLICAVLSAQMVRAAVPIEESVEEPRTVRSPGTQPPTAASRSSLDIPPTIEPARVSASDQAPRPLSTGVPSTGNSTSGTGGQLSQLFYQVQMLQQELQNLRGQLEEQSHQLQRLQADQKEQYLDLDRRVAALSDGSSPRSGSTSAAAPPALGTDGGSSAGLSERDAYQAAFDAMRARDFDPSMAGFRQLVQTYPNGQFTPNAYYWMGEIYLVAYSDPEQARQSFMQVVNLYPDHQKAPDALYKLGVAYHNLGDIPSARNFLQRVQTEYPNSSAAGLASKYAAELR